MHQATEGKLLNQLEEVSLVDSLSDPNVTLLNNVQFTMFNNFIFIFKEDDNDNATDRL